jgi:hypothetical protein
MQLLRGVGALADIYKAEDRRTTCRIIIKDYFCLMAYLAGYVLTHLPLCHTTYYVRHEIRCHLRGVARRLRHRLLRQWVRNAILLLSIGHSKSWQQ